MSSRCRADSVWLSPSRKLDLRTHALVALLPGRGRARIDHRRDLDRLRRAHPGWDGRARIVAYATAGTTRARATVADVAAHAGEVVVVDERVANGRLPVDRGAWVLASLAHNTDPYAFVESLGGPHRAAARLFGPDTATKPVCRAFARLWDGSRSQGEAANTAALAAAAAPLLDPNRVAQLLERRWRAWAPLADTVADDLAVAFGAYPLKRRAQLLDEVLAATDAADYEDLERPAFDDDDDVDDGWDWHDDDYDDYFDDGWDDADALDPVPPRYRRSGYTPDDDGSIDVAHVDVAAIAADVTDPNIAWVYSPTFERMVPADASPPELARWAADVIDFDDPMWPSSSLGVLAAAHLAPDVAARRVTSEYADPFVVAHVDFTHVASPVHDRLTAVPAGTARVGHDLVAALARNPTVPAALVAAAAERCSRPLQLIPNIGPADRHRAAVALVTHGTAPLEPRDALDATGTLDAAVVAAAVRARGLVPTNIASFDGVAGVPDELLGAFLDRAGAGDQVTAAFFDEAARRGLAHPVLAAARAAAVTAAVHRLATPPGPGQARPARVLAGVPDWACRDAAAAVAAAVGTGRHGGNRRLLAALGLNDIRYLPAPVLADLAADEQTAAELPVDVLEAVPWSPGTMRALSRSSHERQLLLTDPDRHVPVELLPRHPLERVAAGLADSVRARAGDLPAKPRSAAELLVPADGPGRYDLDPAVAELDGTDLADVGRLTVFDTPRALRANAEQMRNCTYAFHRRDLEDGRAVIGAVDTPDGTRYNFRFDRTPGGWRVDEVNSRFNTGVVPAAVSAALDGLAASLPAAPLLPAPAGSPSVRVAVDALDELFSDLEVVELDFDRRR